MNNKIKIAYMVSTLEACGPVNVIFNIIKYLDKNIYEPHIITLSKELENTRMNDFKNENCIIHQMNLSRVRGIFELKKNIQYIIETNDIKIVHSNGFRSDNIACRLENVKSISTIHNYPKYDYRMTYGNLKGIVMANLHINWMRYIDLPCACSESVYNDLISYVGEKLAYVQNGIDISIFNYKNEFSNNKLRDKLSLPKDKIIFVVVGTITSRKDPKTILECFKKRNNENELVIFLGDGDMYNLAKENYDEYDNIMLLGRVDNVNEYMQASDYYISASLAEGLPNTVMEALASGLPCILSNINPHLEIVKYDMETVKLFECEDTKSLSNAIDEIKLVDYNKISRLCRMLVEKNLSAQIMTKNYEKKYKKVLE